MTTQLKPGTYVRHTKYGNAVVMAPTVFRQLMGQRADRVRLQSTFGGAEPFHVDAADCELLSDWDVKIIKARQREQAAADRKAAVTGGIVLGTFVLLFAAFGALADSGVGKDMLASFEAWRNAPPACEYRLVPQRDGSILAYRC